MFLSQKSFIRFLLQLHLGSGHPKTDISCLPRYIDHSLLRSQTWTLLRFFLIYPLIALEHSAQSTALSAVSISLLGINLPNCARSFETFTSSALCLLAYR